MPGATGGHCFTAVMPWDNAATAVAPAQGCGALRRGSDEHCQGCHVTFDDEVLFDVHRLIGICVPSPPLDLVVTGGVWCVAGCSADSERRQRGRSADGSRDNVQTNI